MGRSTHFALKRFRFNIFLVILVCFSVELAVVGALDVFYGLVE